MDGLSTNNVLSNLNNFPRLTKSIAITLSIFLFLGIISPPRFYLWTFFTASLTETSIISGIFNIIALLFIGKYLEPIWGSREFIKFILVVIFFSSLCSFFFFVFKFMFFGGIDLIMKANVCGFSGVIAAFSVALKQLITEQEFNFFLIKIRAKWIPFILILFRVIVFSFIGFQDRSFTLVIYGVFIAWIYLRFYQVKSGVKGDLNESFSFYTFFPDPVQAPIKVISNIVFKILCKLSICSSSRFSNQSILPTTNNNNNINNNDDSYSVADMERRRALAVKALEERMQQQQQQQNQQQQQQQQQNQQQQNQQQTNLNISIDSQDPK
ncbi:hypothetical protein ACTFIZ_006818 [Dictyostelium cf. discoideum]